jgi:hypothetical protein
VNHAANGPFGSASQAWDLDSQEWDEDTTNWNAVGTEASAWPKSLLASNEKQLYKMDSSFEFDQLIPGALLERRGLALGEDDEGGVVQNDRNLTIITGIFARISGAVGREVTISVGYHNSDPTADPTYPTRGVMIHIIGETIRNSCLVSGRYNAIKFETDGTFQWSLDSLDIEFTMEGEW